MEGGGTGLYGFSCLPGQTCQGGICVDQLGTTGGCGCTCTCAVLTRWSSDTIISTPPLCLVRPAHVPVLLFALSVLERGRGE